MSTAVVAHRGGSALAPENTLAAIRSAVALGVEAVEIDVQRTRDGRLVVHHDETLARTAGVRAARGRAGPARAPGARRGPPVCPRVRRRADSHPGGSRRCAAGGGKLVADFKHGDERSPGLSEQIAGFARALGPSRLAVISIRHDFAARVAEAAPGVLALFTYRAPFATDAGLRALHDLPPGVGFGASLRALSAGMLVVAREDGRAVYAFTPNTTSELSVALTVGVDAVITDHPDLALDLRRRLMPDGAATRSERRSRLNP